MSIANIKRYAMRNIKLKPMAQQTLLIITPAREAGMIDRVYHLLVAETGEHLASHLCSHYGFACGDLYENRPERKEEWAKRFGDVEVKFIDETDISEEELIRRNNEWFDANQPSETQNI